PTLTREEVLNATRPAVPAPGNLAVRPLLDDWLPGSARALDDFWQAVADGSLRLGEPAAAALGPAIAPVREGLRLRPDLPLRQEKRPWQRPWSRPCSAPAGIES